MKLVTMPSVYVNLPASLFRRPLTCSPSFTVASRDMGCIARSSSVIPPRLPSFYLSFFCRIRDCTRSVLYSARASTYIHARRTCDERKRVVATRVNSVPRASFISTAVLPCLLHGGRERDKYFMRLLMPSDEMYFYFVHDYIAVTILYTAILL